MRRAATKSGAQWHGQGCCSMAGRHLRHRAPTISLTADPMVDRSCLLAPLFWIILGCPRGEKFLVAQEERNEFLQPVAREFEAIRGSILPVRRQQHGGDIPTGSGVAVDWGGDLWIAHGACPDFGSA